MPQVEPKVLPGLLSESGLVDLLNGISPYMARRYRTTFTTSDISST